MLKALFVASALSLMGIGPAFADPPPPPPPPAADEAVVWYYAVSGRSEGPMTVSALRQAASAGKIVVDTQVYEPTHGWRFAKDVPELQGFLVVAAPLPAGAPPPPPPPTTQQAYNEKLKTYMVGTWQLDQVMPVGSTVFNTRYEFVFRKDGTLGGSLTTSMPPENGITVPPTVAPLSGTWLVSASDDTHFVLTITIDAYTPSSINLTVLDQNTLQLAAGTKMVRLR